MAGKSAPEYWLKENTENYTGEFVNDHYQGQGTYRWVNGHRYEGLFAGDKHGLALSTSENGYRTTTALELRDFVDDASSHCGTLPVTCQTPCRQLKHEPSFRGRLAFFEGQLWT